MSRKDLENCYWWTSEEWRDYILSLHNDIEDKKELTQIVDKEMVGNSDYFKGYVQMLCMIKLGF